MPEPLSPAAQAILAAMEEINLDIEEDNNIVAAAALRALAVRIHGADHIRADILAIATELENTNEH